MRVFKGSVWQDKDVRTKNRRVKVMGFDYSDGPGYRRALIRRVLDDGTLDPKGRQTCITCENLSTRFAHISDAETNLPEGQPAGHIHRLD
jgi:hypothetical protein